MDLTEDERFYRLIAELERALELCSADDRSARWAQIQKTCQRIDRLANGPT